MADVTPAQTCVTKSIVLQPGETFNLPEGATLISTSDPDSTDTVCTDIDNLEEVSCFVAILGTNYMDNNGQEITYGSRLPRDNTTTYINAYALDNVVYPFPVSILIEDGNNSAVMYAAEALQDLRSIPGVLDAAFGYKQDQTSGRQSFAAINYFVIKTIPSIASELQLILRSHVSQQSIGGTNTSFQRIPFKPRADAVAEGYVGIPACP